jgi:hypothetical protein
MRYIVFSLLLPFCLGMKQELTFTATSKSQSSLSSTLSSSSREGFYPTAVRLVQDQLNLIARIEQAISSPDPNQMRAVGGQLIVQTKAIESFLNRQYKSPKALCHQSSPSGNLLLANQLSASQAQIYCSLFASSQELLKLTPVLDQLLSRRGELALVRQLPLVSGERQSDPVLSLAPVVRPNLGKPATPFSTQEPNLPLRSPATTRRTAKKPLANYQPPMQPAILPPTEAIARSAAPQGAIATLKIARDLIVKATTAFPSGTKFHNPKETAVALDRFAYDLDPQEPQTYAKFLQMPNTGIFRVLPYSAYLRPLNTIDNRLDRKVSDRYPFPPLSEASRGFTPSLTLQIVNENFQMLSPGVDYSFMVDLGNIPLEKLDANLKAVSPQTREFFLNYQPPQQLEALQIERRRFLTGKDQNWNQRQVFLDQAKAVLNHTYLVRTLQFQLPEVINSGLPLSSQQRGQIDRLLETQGSDILLAFRPVRQRSDGSYTVLWKVLDQLSEPQIEDLEQYVKGIGVRD